MNIAIYSYRFWLIFISFISFHQVNTLRLWQNGSHFVGNISKLIFLNENSFILFKTSLKFVAKGQINKSVFVQVMDWCQPADKPLPELDYNDQVQWYIYVSPGLNELTPKMLRFLADG